MLREFCKKTITLTATIAVVACTSLASLHAQELGPQPRLVKIDSPMLVQVPANNNPVQPPAPEQKPKVAPANPVVPAPQVEPEDKKEPAKDPTEELKAEIESMKGDITVATQRGDNAWLLTSCALVLFMTPGLALFYGGMVRKKNILATMMQSYAAMAVVGVYWIAFGYGLAFGPSQITVGLFGVEGGMVGWSWDLFFLSGVKTTDYLPGTNIPIYTHIMFQGMFAIITPALISGSLAERIRFWPWCIFMILWVTLVYCPLAHMVWAFDWFYVDPATPGGSIGGTAVGLLGKMGALDFAGGTVVHIAAGFAGLACCIVLRNRKGFPDHAVHPSSLVLTLLGAAMLWFGWFGFNGGSAINSDTLASVGFGTTQAAAAGAAFSWIFVEWLFKGKPTALGLASGIVAGLVAVTPAAGFVYAWGGLVIGLIAGVVCYFTVQLKNKFKFDDSLDAFGVHGIGGFLGAVLTGIFCYAAVQGASVDGFFAVSGLESRKEAIPAKIEEVKSEIEGIKKEIPDLDKAVTTAKEEKEVEEAKTNRAFADSRIESRNAKITALQDEEKSLVETIATYKEDGKGPLTQFWIQLKAAIFSAVFAFVLSLLLAYGVQAMTLGNFTVSAEDEAAGLDTVEHGEVGFDFSGGEMLPIAGTLPKAASVPPGMKRYVLVVDGATSTEVEKAWISICNPQTASTNETFKEIYPFITTVQGNQVRVRGGEPGKIAMKLQTLFQQQLGSAVKVRIVQ
ncbi:MAG: ammonium transporter [Zavarzinella sp.]